MTASIPGRNAYRETRHMIKILCVDDHPVVLDGLSAIIAMQPEMELAATASKRRNSPESISGAQAGCDPCRSEAAGYERLRTDQSISENR